MRSLIPWRTEAGPFGLWRDMDAVMRRFFGEPLLETEKRALAFEPRLDVEETEKELIVKVDLPGIDPREVELSVLGDVLVLKGERKEEKEEKKKDFHRVERYFGTFLREVPLPAGVDAEKISATAAKGVLTITIPKKPEVLPRKIEVKPIE
jgi:HSP20 family protein